MSDSEYDSEDDEDYIPEEALSEEECTDVANKTVRKKGKKTTKKRKGGIQLEDDIDEVSDHEESEEDAKLEEKDDSQENEAKNRVADLWTAFKRDTAVMRPATSSNVKTVEKIVENKSEDGKVKGLTSAKEEKKAPCKVEITEIFDFAGEEVKVVKSVDASSVKPASSSGEDIRTATKPKTGLLMKRSGGGLGSVLGKIGKKPKLSTLEKSKLDWNSFKKEEGIEDELKTSNRDGYLEKQAFLNRVDHKQFEIERDIRQGFKKK